MCDTSNRRTVMRSEAPLHCGVASTGPPLVVWCGCNSIHQARLHDALRGIARLQSLEQLGVVAPADVPDILVIAIEPGAARDCVAQVREIRCKYPRTALVAYCGAVADTPASIGALAAAGIHQFLF